ncbi:hypothetical protein LCGC14_2899190, partial [marine sediment metagenome]
MTQAERNALIKRMLYENVIHWTHEDLV